MQTRPGRSALGLTLTAVLACSSPARAADPADVGAILAKMREASGGEAWDSVRSLHAEGVIDAGGSTARIDHLEDVATGRYRVRDDRFTGVTQEGFDGETAWRQGRSGIAYALGDLDADLVVADEAFRVSRAWWFRDRHPATIALTGTRSDGDRTFDVLSVTPEGGRAFEAWIDRSTHLLFRTDEQQAEDRVVTTYEDYREVDGVKIPFSVRTGDGSDPSFDEVETMRSIELNTKVPDSSYSLPPLPPSDISFPRGRSSTNVKFRLTADNRILIPITLNGGLETVAEFDSGGGLLLQATSLEKLGVVSGGRQKQGGGGEGSTISKSGRIKSLQIGSAIITGLAFHSFAFRPEEPDEALIGLETLQRFVVRFDFDHLIMTLTRPDTFHYQGRRAVIPFHFQDNQPEVKGSIDGVAGRFAIDTGDNSSLLLIAPFARRYAMVDRYQADIPYDGKAVSSTHGVWARKRASTVALDGSDGRPAVEVRDPVTRISLQHSGFDANRNVSANIGLGILRQFNITFDYARQRLICEPNHFHGQPDVFNRTGLRLHRDGDGWSITAVYQGSPASDVGLVTGQRIVAVNGRRAVDINDDTLSELLKGPLGSDLLVTVVTGSTLRMVSLKLRDVI